MTAVSNRIALNCSCGASLRATVRGGGVEPKRATKAILDVWGEVHSGKGHASCDAATAARARRKNEKWEGKS